jgi:3-oxoacyl-(acyl-carrier-protein) synthase
MSIVVTGLGDDLVQGTPCDPTPWLKVRKNRKFMGVQDDLAVAAAGRALQSAGLAGEPLGERTGLYLTVGFIPFEREHVEGLLAGALENGRFSMARFTDVGYRDVHPLLTFRCLPNMPAFHVSMNFDLQGPYFVTYPGAGQLYQALEEACAALTEGRVDVALVGGVAHQRNFLVEHHFGRLSPPVSAERLVDAGAFLVLETGAHAHFRGAPVRARLDRYHIAYEPHLPQEPRGSPEEQFLMDGARLTASGDLGAAALPAMLSRSAGRGGRLEHWVKCRDGLCAASDWELA